MRSAMIAMDNDSSHNAKMTVRNLIDHHKGILHFGRSGMGEGRPYIEALFKKIENGLLRNPDLAARTVPQGALINGGCTGHGLALQGSRP